MDYSLEGMTMVLGELYFNHRVLEDQLEQEKGRSEDYKMAYDKAVIERDLAISHLSKPAKNRFEAEETIMQIREGGKDAENK
jgi:hypothetical protein